MDSKNSLDQPSNDAVNKSDAMIIDEFDSNHFDKTVKQYMATYRHSRRTADDLQALATQIEAITSAYLVQANADDAYIFATINTELSALQRDFAEDALLSGFIIGWQAREDASISAVLAADNPDSSLANSIELERLTAADGYDPASWWMVIAISLLVWMLATLPKWDFIPGVKSIDELPYYVLVAPACVAIGLSMYFYFIQSPLNRYKKYWLGAIVLYSALLMTSVFKFDLDRSLEDYDGLFMMWLHSPIVLLGLLGALMYSHARRSWQARLAFIQYLGEIGVLSILILFGGVILTGFTLMLFEFSGSGGVIEWYITNIVPLGIVATPLVASHLYLTVFNERSRLASILIQIFSPLCALTFLLYLLTMLFTGVFPTEDREALISTNGLLLIIWLLTVYHIIARKPQLSAKHETDAEASSLVATGQFGLMDRLNAFMLLVVSVFNVIILYSMMHRIFAYGFSLNRLIVIGVNVLIFIHLCWIAYHYLRLWRQPTQGDTALKKCIADYLPVYAIWAFIVVLIVPVYNIIL